MFLWFCEPWIVPVMTQPNGPCRARNWLSSLFDFWTWKTSRASLTSFRMSTVTFLSYLSDISMSTRCGCDLLSKSSGRHFSAMLNFSDTSPFSTVMTYPSPLADCNLNSATSNSSSSCCKRVLTDTLSFWLFRPSSLATSGLIMVPREPLSNSP